MGQVEQLYFSAEFGFSDPSQAVLLAPIRGSPITLLRLYTYATLELPLCTYWLQPRYRILSILKAPQLLLDDFLMLGNKIQYPADQNGCRRDLSGMQSLEHINSYTELQPFPAILAFSQHQRERKIELESRNRMCIYQADASSHAR